MQWLQGADRIPTRNEQEFWIDLEPVTAEEYLPLAEQFVRDGKLERFESVLLTQRDQSRAIKATDMKQVPQLLGQLQSIFDVVKAEDRARRQPDAKDTTGLPEIPTLCPRCPARMTMIEATLCCAYKNKALPTDLEWEVASRGVDGRLYPWENAFDSSRANVVGLPEKSQTPGLVTVHFYPNSRSPFGLCDTVGNAGDWIDSRGGYSRTFMGGTYRFNKEEALTYSTMPDTGDPLPQLPVTARCVSRKPD
jgi:formylglycine-generating enzyme required for sulfatase activity